MGMRNSSAKVGAVLTVLGLAALSASARQPARPADAEADRPDQPALAGPRVAPEEEGPRGTLVQRDAAGRLVRLDVHPAEAAVRLMELDPTTRGKVDEILQRRAVETDAFVRANLGLLFRVAEARARGDHEAYAQLGRELTEKAHPLREVGRLPMELAAVLPAERRAEFRRLVQEYFRAALEEGLESSPERGGGIGAPLPVAPDRAAAEDDGPDAMTDGAAAERLAPGMLRRRLTADSRETRRAAFEEFAEVVRAELRRGLDRTVGADLREFDALLAELQTTPEQEQKIRAAVQEVFTRTGGQLTPSDRAGIFRTVWPMLTPQQQQKLLERGNLGFSTGR